MTQQDRTPVIPAGRRGDMRSEPDDVVGRRIVPTEDGCFPAGCFDPLVHALLTTLNRVTTTGTPPGSGADVDIGTPAYKEWAVIVSALLSGEQIVDIRKGGLREEGRHFDLRSPTFWLYPTSEHQRPELLKTAYRHRIELSPGSPVGEPVTVPGWAEVVATATVTDPEELDALNSKLIWTPDYAESRLRWKSRDPLWVLALRVHRLETPVVLPWSDDYGGCTSWVDLRGLPADPASLPSTPALSDEAFEARLSGAREALPALEPAAE
ncbi:MAG: DUF1802 family protein [Acidimicrobiia bacterium]|nr:DUF1802 family protein [Acidimicrobiia bacterium]